VAVKISPKRIILVGIKLHAQRLIEIIYRNSTYKNVFFIRDLLDQPFLCCVIFIPDLANDLLNNVL